jgi:hypothetical protein
VIDVTIRAASPSGRVVFQDGLGRRLLVTPAAGDETLELLVFDRYWATRPSFELALRERVDRLAGLDQTYFARVRGVGRRTTGATPLLLATSRAPGVRLSELLATAERHDVPCDLPTALCLTRQMLEALAILHEQAPGTAHGAIGPQRIVVTPEGRLVFVEYVLGKALERLQYSCDEYWQDLGIAFPAPDSAPPFSQRGDVSQVALIALSLLTGRRLPAAANAPRAQDLLHLLPDITARGPLQPLVAPLRSWLRRALGADPADPFASGLEAWAELEMIAGQADDEIPATAGQLFARCVGSEPVSPNAWLAQPERFPPAAPATSLVPRSFVTLRLFDPPPEAKPEALAVVDETVPTVFTTVMDNPPHGRWRRQLAAALFVALLAGATAAAAWALSSPEAVTAHGGMGSLAIHTNPPGAQAIVDGTPRGSTPVTVRLTEGAHLIEVRGRGGSRTIPVAIEAGRHVSQSVELPQPPSNWGQLDVRTDPPGEQVTIDGVPLGASPMRVDLAAGEHVVVLGGDDSGKNHRVLVEAGATTSLVVPRPPERAAAPAAAPAPASTFGWLSVIAPVDVQIYQSGHLLGSSQSRQIMMRAGRHQLEIANDVLGYRGMVTLEIRPGETTSVPVEFPSGTLVVNATPGTEVWIDGKHAGRTPLDALSVPLGPHEVIFRHPDLGERHYAVSVTLMAPTRLDVDLKN